MTKRRPKKGGSGRQDGPPAPDRRTLDETIAGIMALLEGQEFTSIEEINAYLQELLIDGQPLPPPMQGGSGDIPEIPDIVAMLNPAEVEVKPPRENNYPLLKRDGTPKGSLGGAAGASLFAAALNRVEDTSASDPQPTAQTEVE